MNEAHITIQYDGKFDYDRVLDILYREDIYKELPPKIKLIASEEGDDNDEVRMILKLLEVEYDEEKVNVTAWDVMRNEYQESNKIYFNELPLLVYGEDYIQHKYSIIKYLGKKFNKAGKSDIERINIDMFIEKTILLNNEYQKIKNENELVIENYKNKILTDYLDSAERIVGSSDNLHVYLNDLNIGDVLLYHNILINKKLQGCDNILEPYKKLSKFNIIMSANQSLRQFLKDNE